ncbi:hypothetical protein [Salinibaculum salinum]|uniref:hypothetical protein n=1 Tax=Salinibaculum salinum TaxID=3131996 RepID=UPI0030ED74F0
METLAVIESDPETLASAVETAALYEQGDTDQEMFVRLTDDCIETPASAAGATRSSYCTLAADHFDRLDVRTASPLDAMFEIGPFLGWLDWVDTDSVAVHFRGDHAVTELVLRADDDEVTIGCSDDPAVLDAVETDLPDRFAGARFLDADGNPMPTTVETTAGQLVRLVDAVDLAESEAGYPLVVRDGHLAVDVTGENARATAPLDSTVDGPAVTNYYGADFAAVVAGLTGHVTLQTGPGEAVAFVQERDAYTLRFVVTTL